MKAKITFYIGLFVAVLNTVQLVVSFDSIRFLGIGIGIFFMVWGYKIGWTRNRNLTMVVGHIAMTVGSFVTAYALYQLPFLTESPSYMDVLDLPLFWGLFTIWGGKCMITHGFCSCVVKMHERNNKIKIPQL